VGEDGTTVHVAVGAVRSRVTEEALRLATGPTLLALSLTPEAASLNTTVPSEQEDTVTVIVEPEAAEGVNTQPVAVPVFEKSADVKPEMPSEKVRI
jgi:hypothetical protein